MNLVSIVSVFFLFSSRRRHTRCALVTGVQTCALPISRSDDPDAAELLDVKKNLADVMKVTKELLELKREGLKKEKRFPDIQQCVASRSEERRVGKECVLTGRSRWSPSH